MAKRENKTTQEISLSELSAAKSSIGGRLSRLRETRCNWYSDSYKSPIAKIDAFQTDIDTMEETLKSMKKRLNNAKITVEI